MLDFGNLSDEIKPYLYQESSSRGPRATSSPPCLYLGPTGTFSIDDNIFLGAGGLLSCKYRAWCPQHVFAIRKVTGRLKRLKTLASCHTFYVFEHKCFFRIYYTINNIQRVLVTDVRKKVISAHDTHFL